VVGGHQFAGPLCGKTLDWAGRMEGADYLHTYGHLTIMLTDLKVGILPTLEM
jgi:hypothetical protein